MFAGLNRGAIVFVVFICLFSLPSSAGWMENIEQLIATEDEAEQEQLLESISMHPIDHYDVMSVIDAIEFADAERKGKFTMGYNICSDDVERPYVLYIPKSYDPTVETKLLVILHGGVGNLKLPSAPLGYARQSPFSWFGAEKGWFVLYPMGQAGAVWWDDVGMDNVADQIHTIKRTYNIDDNGVYMGGFSDGASAAFIYGMVRPNDFGAFVALNGHIGVGCLDGGMQTYIRNLANTPTYTTTTDKDPLYRTEIMAPSIELAISAGADLHYRKLKGIHRFDYGETELPLIFEYFNERPRDPIPDNTVCEAIGSKFGKIRWFEITGVDGDSEPADYHNDLNVKLIGDRLSLGFAYDENFEGVGNLVAMVFEETPAYEAGLREGDILIKCDDTEIKTIDDIYVWKETVARGDKFKLVVLRDDKEVKLKGQFAEPEEYELFVYEEPSALAKVVANGNTINVTASRLGGFAIYVHPDMFDIEQNLIINVNGELVYDDMIKVDTDYMLRNFLAERDRKAVYVNKIDVEL